MAEDVTENKSCHGLVIVDGFVEVILLYTLNFGVYLIISIINMSFLFPKSFNGSGVQVLG